MSLYMRPPLSPAQLTAWRQRTNFVVYLIDGLLTLVAQACRNPIPEYDLDHAAIVADSPRWSLATVLKYRAHQCQTAPPCRGQSRDRKSKGKWQSQPARKRPAKTRTRL